MTPVVLLVVFCVAMSAIAIGRLAIDGKPESVDLGATLIVVGSTLLAALWLTIEASVSTVAGQVVLGASGSLSIGAGTVLLYRWL